MKWLLIASFPESIIDFRGPLISAMQERGLEVHVAAPELLARPAIRDALISMGVVVHDIPLQRAGTNPARDVVLLWSLLDLMQNVRPDAVLSYTVKPVIFGSIAAWIARVPKRYALITGLGFAFTGQRGGMLGWLVTRLYTFALRRTSKVFFQNPDDQDLFRERGILADNQPSVVVNGSGVDLSVFDSEPVPTTPPSFLMIGRLLGDKGVREYVEAARRVRETNSAARFSLVGWIDENPDSISQAELDAWTREGNIEFLGRLEDVRPAIADSSVYVLASYREGTPRTVLEAMAMGRAIITTDAPGCRETVVDGENGFLVPTHSVDELVTAMQRFIDDPLLATSMGRRSRQIAEEKYDVRKVNAVMLREMEIT